MNRVEERKRERRKQSFQGFLLLVVPVTTYYVLTQLFPEGLCTWFC